MIKYCRCELKKTQQESLTHRSRRGHLQIHRLKHEVGCWGQLDDLTRHEAQLLVVVKHCVHVLDPDGVDWPVKQEPLPVF